MLFCLSFGVLDDALSWEDISTADVASAEFESDTSDPLRRAFENRCRFGCIDEFLCCRWWRVRLGRTSFGFEYETSELGKYSFEPSRQMRPVAKRMADPEIADGMV